MEAVVKVDRDLDHEAIEPPFQFVSSDQKIERIRGLLTAMGKKARPLVIYTTLPACNAEA